MANPFHALRQYLEKVAFAGLKPDAPAGPKKSKIGSLIQSAGDLATRDLKPGSATGPKKSMIGSLIQSAGNLATRDLKPDEAPLPGPASWRKKAGIAAAVVVILGVVATLVIMLQSPADKAESEAVVSGPPAPLLPPGFQVEKNQGLTVEEIEFNKTKTPKEITGILRNLTDRQIESCDVSFDVTTSGGSGLGGVATTVHNLPARGTARFRIEVPEKDADFAMVRELRIN